MFFFSALHCPVGATLFDRQQKESCWLKGTVRFSNLLHLEDAVEMKGWYQPTSWNQGGYDAVFIDIEEGTRKRHVRFVHVANGLTHDLRLDYMYLLLKCFAEHFETNEVEIVFVVSPKRLEEFKIVKVIGSGLLNEFGWHTNKEIDQCKILALKHWTF